MLHLFIDTNVLIKLYNRTDDNLSGLREFIKTVTGGKKLILYVPEQVCDEYARNVEHVLASSLMELDGLKFPNSLPRFTEHYTEATILRSKIGECLQARDKLTDKLRTDFTSGQILADQLIQQLLETGKPIKTTKEIIDKAYIRRDVGNPPGKKQSLGDQINWESLLDGVPDKNDLYIISRDGDYESDLDRSIPKKFLSNEWKDRKKATLYLYPTVGSFAKAHNLLPSSSSKTKKPAEQVKPAIIADSDEKRDAINKLVKSGSFATTHVAIAALKLIYDEIGPADAKILFQAVIDNGQVGWISSDDDVKSFYEKLYKKYFDQTTAEMDAELLKIADYFDIPF